MASKLQEMRREAGFTSAKAFSDHIGMAFSTYARYEQNPDKIPLSAAWGLADQLKCSIDDIVGRDSNAEDPLVTLYKNLSIESRELFDEMVQFVKAHEAKLKAKKKLEENKKYDDYMRYYEKLLLDSADKDSEHGDLAIFGTEAEKREAFRIFVTRRAEQKREESLVGIVAAERDSLEESSGLRVYTEPELNLIVPEENRMTQEQVEEALAQYEAQVAQELREDDERILKGIMKAYDRAHPQIDQFLTPQFGSIEYATVRFDKDMNFIFEEIGKEKKEGDQED